MLSIGLLFMFAAALVAADLPGSKDPSGMKRYEGSEIIGYRPAKFDEFTLPLSIPIKLHPPQYAKSLPVEGQISRHTYLAPPGRSPAELVRNYKLEFQRMGAQILFEKQPGEKGWFGPTFAHIADEDRLGQILGYNEREERLVVVKTRDAKPSYYLLFATSYKNGVIPQHLKERVKPGSALGVLVSITPEAMQEKMVFVSADEMQRSLRDTGKVALYGLYFDVDKDVVKAESQPTLVEIAKLLKQQTSLRIHVVGHTDNQGRPDYNVDLSRRRAANVVKAMTTSFGIGADRLDAFGCGLYAPAASNDNEEGRAKNRRVELVRW